MVTSKYNIDAFDKIGQWSCSLIETARWLLVAGVVAAEDGVDRHLCTSSA